jgi:hypothetical protein
VSGRGRPPPAWQQTRTDRNREEELVGAGIVVLASDPRRGVRVRFFRPAARNRAQPSF